MSRLSMFYGFFLALLLASCDHTIPSKDELPATTLQIHLGDLRQESSNEQWEQFFKERGALKIWEELKQKKEQVDIRLEKLEEPVASLTNQADQVGAGIIHYLIYHNSKVKKLLLIGNSSNSKQRLTTLPPAIGQLTSLTTLLLDNNQLSNLPSELGKVTSLTTLQLQTNQLPALPARLDPYLQTVLPKNQLNRIDSNPWLQDKDLFGPVGHATLLAYTHFRLSKTLTPTFGDFTPYIPKPLNVKPEEVLARKAEIDGKRIIYFQKFQETSIPFYWDLGIYTNQDVESTVDVLKDKPLFLISEDQVKE